MNAANATTNSESPIKGKSNKPSQKEKPNFKPTKNW
jgi:hypothetical protein